MNQPPTSTISDERVSQDAWYLEYAPQGIRYANAMLHNLEDAEEAVQDAFVRLMKSENHADRPANWHPARFFTTIRNLCIDLIRKQKKKRQLSLDHVQELAAGERKPSIESTETIDQIHDELNALPESWRRALQMKLQEDKSYEEIAQAIGATHAQVRSWIYRARKQLRQRLLDTTSSFKADEVNP